MKEFFQKFSFHPVIQLPAEYEVYDFSGVSGGYDPDRPRKNQYGIGKYNEKRVGMYTQALFGNERDIHVGIDLAAPVGEPVYSFYEGEIFLFKNNSQAGDYGPTIITKHILDGKTLYALYGHLSLESLDHKASGQKIAKGEVIAWIGDEKINGGWKNPHVHFQLSWEEPLVADMPGAVSQEDLESALKKYPDPRWVLGPLY